MQRLFISCGFIFASALATHAVASDQTFLKKALEGDNSEIALGQLAEQHGSSVGIRDFGQMLHDDHTASKANVLPVAQAHGVADTSEMAPEANVEARKLSRLSGRAFDHEFARYMVADHEHDIADFEREVRQGDSATATLARETLPDLRKHLAMAQHLAGR
jgi:putative membrane protein